MADLSKFGVPIDGEKQGILEPKKAYRFRVVFQNFGTNNNLRELTANVQQVSRPNITHAKGEVHSYNSIAYYAGKHTWNPITLIVRDDITNAVTSAVHSQVQRQMNHLEQIGPVAGTNYKFGMQIHSLDGTNGEELESWDLTGCFLESVENQEYNYTDTAGHMTISMTIQYDNATLLSGPNDNDGTTVGGDPFPNLTDGFTGGTSIG